MVSENLDARAGDVITSINMGHAVMWPMDTWNRVTEETIKNCWLHAGFTRLVDPPSTTSSELLVETESLAVLLEQLNISVDGFHFEEGEMPVAEEERGEWENEILCPETDVEELDDAEEVITCPVTLAEAQRGLAAYLSFVDFNNEELGIIGKQYTSLRDQLRSICVLRAKASKSGDISSYFTKLT
jgi:hypothetical protein